MDLLNAHLPDDSFSCRSVGVKRISEMPSAHLEVGTLRKDIFKTRSMEALGGVGKNGHPQAGPSMTMTKFSALTKG
jgi:hypothetical protein